MEIAEESLTMPQPPYSPDMAPCDFFLFPKIKRTLKGRRFAAIHDIKSASLKELKAIPNIEFEKCFEDWKKRWHKCIISNGDYFKGDNINVDEQINIFFKKRKFPLFSEHTSYMRKNPKPCCCIRQGSVTSILKVRQKLSSIEP